MKGETKHDKRNNEFLGLANIERRKRHGTHDKFEGIIVKIVKYSTLNFAKGLARLD